MAPTRIEMLMQVIGTLKPTDGWVCRALTSMKVVMEHPEHGRRVAVLVSGTRMVVRDRSEDDRAQPHSGNRPNAPATLA